jgi:uncharacterized protein YjbI with pentapeptide repeats
MREEVRLIWKSVIFWQSKMSEASTEVPIEDRKQLPFRRVTPKRITKTCSSLLLPITICVFTIVTTVIQMNLGKQQREQDLHIAMKNREQDLQISKENREKDFEIANQTRILQNEIEENRRIADIQTQQNQQMNAVLAVYLKDMAELMLLGNFTISDRMIATVIRAKTLTTLGQLDGKRKGHIVRFLYEAKMMITGQPAIDLTEADLSNVDLTNYKLVNASLVKCNLFGAVFSHAHLQNVDFKNSQLVGALFDRSELADINFYEANLTNASFIDMHSSAANFEAAIVTKTDFTSANLVFSKWANAKGNYTVFNEALVRVSKLAGSIFMNTSFVKADLTHTDMSNATFYRSNFTYATLFGAKYAYSNLSESIFDRSVVTETYFYSAYLQGSTWLDAVVNNADFSKANLHNASVTDAQMRLNWKNIDTIFPDGIKGADANLLENEGAEGENNQCTTDPWHLNSMVTRRDDTMMARLFDQCNFKVQWNVTQAKMWQRVRIPNQYGKWISTGVAIIRIISHCVSHLPLYVFTILFMLSVGLRVF